MSAETESPPGGAITTGEAAERLGVKSINTVKRWIREGLLDGYRRGGRILVSAESVARLAKQPVAADRRAWEQQLDGDLDAFMDESAPPVVDLTATWEGRKPWTAAAQAPSTEGA